MHCFDAFCNNYGITHKTIRPRTPWHNGKVEQSHRNDQERFYSYLKFYSYNDLIKQMRAYLHRSNRIPIAVLGWKTPIQKRAEFGEWFMVRIEFYHDDAIENCMSRIYIGADGNEATLVADFNAYKRSSAVYQKTVSHATISCNRLNGSPVYYDDIVFFRTDGIYKAVATE